MGLAFARIWFDKSTIEEILLGDKNIFRQENEQKHLKYSLICIVSIKKNKRKCEKDLHFIIINVGSRKTRQQYDGDYTVKTCKDILVITLHSFTVT